MDVQLSEEQNLLCESARDFLERECPMSLVRAQMEDPCGFPDLLWKRMAELGWIGLAVDESYGGSSLGGIDLALLLEEMGRVLLPGPFVSTAVVGATALALAGSSEQKRRLLPRLVAGELRMALAQLEEESRWDAEGVQLEARPLDGGYEISGRKLFADDAQCADCLIVPVRTRPGGSRPEEGISLLLVESPSPGLRLRPIATNEQTRKTCEVVFEGLRVPESSLLGEWNHGWKVLEQVLDHAKVALCAEMAGGARKVLELSVEYARQREQFGQPIGRFQAIQHKCADMLVKTEGIKSAAYYAAWALTNAEPDAHTSACLAKAWCSDAYLAVAGEGIQIHGGLGFTWEQDLHLYFKRAQAMSFAFGDPRHNRELAARDLIDSRPA